MDNIDQALRSKFLKYKVNQNILIFKGIFVINIENKKDINIDGKIYLSWLPSLRIRFEGVVTGENSFDVYFLKFEINKSLTTPKGHYSSVTIDSIQYNEHSYTINGHCIEISKKSQFISNIKFCLINCINVHGNPISIDKLMYRGRTEFIYEGWKIILDVRKDYTEFTKVINKLGSYGITHIGNIERITKLPFEYKEIKGILDKLSWLLSFVSGRQIGICMEQGYLNRRLVWERFQTPIIAPWQKKQTWYPANKMVNDLPALLVTFCEKLKEPLWEKTLIIILSWYFDSQSSSYTETRILSAQVALETFAWTYLVEQNNLVSKTLYRKSSSSVNICKLIECFSINIDIPNIKEFSEIRSNYNNGVHLLTTERNNIVHPEKNNEISGLERFYVLQLGIYYLELSILNLLIYNKEFSNRFSKGEWVGLANEIVPWAIE